MSKIFSRYHFLFVFAMLLHGKLLFAQESIIRIMSADDKELALVECDDYYDYNKGFAAVKVDSFWAFYDSILQQHHRITPEHVPQIRYT